MVEGGRGCPRRLTQVLIASDTEILWRVSIKLNVFLATSRFQCHQSYRTSMQIYIVGWGVDLFLDVKQGCISSPGSHNFPGNSLFQPFQTKSPRYFLSLEETKASFLGGEGG